jgi:transposase
MSGAFQLGASLHVPLADITFDRFHVMKLFNEAVDQVRREEQLDRPELKRTRWLWLKSQEKLTQGQLAELKISPAAQPDWAPDSQGVSNEARVCRGILGTAADPR